MRLERREVRAWAHPAAAAAAPAPSRSSAERLPRMWSAGPVMSMVEKKPRIVERGLGAGAAVGVGRLLVVMAGVVMAMVEAGVAGVAGGVDLLGVVVLLAMAVAVAVAAAARVLCRELWRPAGLVARHLGQRGQK